MKIPAIKNVNISRFVDTRFHKCTCALAACAAGLACKAGLSTKENNNTSEILKNNFIAEQNILSPAEIQKISGEGIHENKTITVFTGSSGVGKDTLLRKFLAEHPEYKLSVSYTTRPIRPNEQNGVDYYFITEKEFQEGIDNGEFLEWADFSGNKYGTKKQSIENSLEKTNNLILKLDTTGALNVKKLYPQAVLIFIAPPSLEELETRLRGRNTESEEAIQKRLSVVKKEMELSKQFNYTIVNDTVDSAIKQLEKILIKN